MPNPQPLAPSLQPLAGLVVPVLCWALAGCASRTVCDCHKFQSLIPSPQPPATSPQLAPRGTFSTDVAILTSYEAVDRVLGPETVPLQYRTLEAADCQCVAAANSPAANLIDIERQAAGLTPRGRPAGELSAAAVRTGTLAFAALEERNESAAAALEAFYLLAEAEANRDLLRQSLEEINHAIDHFQQLKARGFHIAADHSELRRQKLDILQRRTQLHLSIRQLNGRLGYLLGLEVDDPTPIWPAADLKVTLAAVDSQEAVHQGLATRADLGMLQMLSESLDGDTLSAVRGALGQINAALGVSPGRAGVLGKLLGRGQEYAELQLRRRQVTELLADRQRAAVQQIRQAAYAVDARLREIALAKEKLDSRQQRLAELRSRRGGGAVTAFDIHAAQLEVIEAESRLMHQVIAWRIAQVKLRQKQGLLAFECGWIGSGQCSVVD